MRKRIGWCAAALFLVLPLFPFGGREKGDAAKQTPITVVGQVGVYGNEPHTWLGFVDQKGVEYKLEASEKILVELRGLQGALLKVSGQLEPVPPGQPVGFQMLSGGTIHLKEFEPYKG